jgi:hypothetical protein
MEPEWNLRRPGSSSRTSPAARAGAIHLVLRVGGDHERHLETVASLRSKLAC